MVYRPKSVQLSINSFGSALGCTLSADNEWVQLANQIPWTKLEGVVHGQVACDAATSSSIGQLAKIFA